MLENFIENPLKIHCCHFQKNIYPWVQKNLYTPFWRFYHNRTEGGFLSLSDGEIIEMTPDYFYIVPGYLHFSTYAEKPFEQFFIHFNLSDRQKTLKHIYKFPAEKIHLDIINDFIIRKQDISKQQLNYFSAAAVLTANLLNIDEEEFTISQPHSSGIEKVLRILDDPARHKRGLDNDHLAMIAGMSRAAFIARFKYETNETPQAYLRRKKIEHACKLLNYSKLSLDEIAEETGFANRYHFTRIFTAQLKVPPALFRKKLSGGDHL